jgi:hypothetical protein
MFKEEVYEAATRRLSNRYLRYRTNNRNCVKIKDVAPLLPLSLEASSRRRRSRSITPTQRKIQQIADLQRQLATERARVRRRDKVITQQAADIEILRRRVGRRDDKITQLEAKLRSGDNIEYQYK